MLDITSFSNALMTGKVSLLASLGARPFVDADGSIVSFRGDDAVVFPVAVDTNRPQLAVRVPLDLGAGRAWPERYADLASIGGSINAHLPQHLSILDVEGVPGVEVTLIHDWVPGETMTTRVVRSRERLARDRLTDLLWPLADVAEALRVSHVMHGDIAPGNLVVRPDGSMVLLDLDRMGFGDVDARRRAGYRLPRAGGSPAAEDAFAMLVLMTTCGVLADAHVPVDHERASPASHPTLLFSSWDLMDPQRSRLVREVESQLSVVTRELLDLLISACNGPADRVPGLVRDAIQVIRRRAPAPGDVPFDGEDVAASWVLVPAAARTEVAAPSSPPPARATPPRRAQQSSMETRREVVPLPRETIDAAPTGSPGPTATSLGERSVAEIVASIQAIQPIDRVDPGSARRSARAAARRERVADRLRGALSANDRATLVDLAMSGALADLGDSEREDVLQVVRALAHDTLSRAVDSDDDERIVAAVEDSVFSADTDVDPEFRERVRLARERERWAARMLAAVHTGDTEMCALLVRQAPADGLKRLPEPIRRLGHRLADEHEALTAAIAAIQERDAASLVAAIGRLSSIRPAWTDHVDTGAVVAVVGVDEIERRLVSRFSEGALPDDAQWMVDIVIAEGRLPEVTRLAGLTPRDANRLIYRES